MELLDFARGPALSWSLMILVFGVVWRLTAILLTPKMKERSEPRPGTPSDPAAFVRGVLTRFWPHKHFERQTLVSHLNGYVFHIGLAIVVFFYRPHILFIQDITGLSWPALPNTMVYGVGLVTVVSLFLALQRRMSNPVTRMLSTADDYISWAVTLTPVLTGLLVVNGIGAKYETLLAIHILSVCALFVWLPFGKLFHTFVFVLSRGVTSVRLSRRGATF
jgi:nitrate reductase gamma subunit